MELAMTTTGMSQGRPPVHNTICAEGIKILRALKQPLLVLVRRIIEVKATPLLLLGM